MKEKAQKIAKKETSLDTLARMMKQGFDCMDERFEQVDKRFEQVDKHFDRMDEKFEQVDERLKSLEYEQKETNRRLYSIERKQTGILSSLDETVTRKEFRVLANKVAVLEKKR